MAAWLSEQEGRPVEVTDLGILVGGASREIYRFGLDGRPLVLRRDPPGVPSPAGARQSEFDAMRAAAATGVPVPEPLYVCEDTSVLDAAFVIMGYLEGETIPRRLLRDEPYAEVRPKLAGEFGRILARLHKADIPPGIRHPEDGQNPAEAELDIMQSRLDMLVYSNGRYPALEFGLRWLRTHMIPPAELTLVHGDFRNGNLMIGPDGVRGVLDWEIVHAGDPTEDLAWVCVRAWRFGHDDMPVGGFGTRDQLIEAYEEESGRTVDRDRLRWWEIARTLWWGIGCGGQASLYLNGLVKNIELAALGRRVAEQEYDLLELLAGRDI